MAITYAPTTNFGLKDSLPTNDSDKVIRGSEFTTEFTAIQTAFSLAAPTASPTFTGTVTIPTADINGGNIDGTVIGAATPAAGSFTTGQFGTSLNVDGTVTADGLTVSAPSGDTPASIVTTTAGAFLSISDGNTTAGRSPLVGVLTDDLVFYTSTGSYSEKVRIKADGNVGIGTSSPSNDLHITGTSGTKALFERTGSTGAYIGLKDSSGSLVYLGDNNGTFEVQTAGSSYSTKLAVTSAGNVGIGTASPAYKIDSNGSVRAYSSTFGDSDVIAETTAATGTGYSRLILKTTDREWRVINDASTSGSPLLIYDATAATERVRIDSSGRLLVGTTSNYGGEALQIDANSVGSTVYTAYISNTNTSTSAYNVMRWAQGAAGSATGMIGTGGSAASNPAFRDSFLVGTQSSNPLVFATADAERMRIDSSGNLLVGGTSYQQGGSTSFASNGRFASVLNSGTGGDYLIAAINGVSNGHQISVSTGNLQTYKWHTGATNTMTLDSSGNLLVGTTGGSFGSRITALSTTSYLFESRRTGTGSEGQMVFVNGNGAVGSIFTNGSATAYNTSSDARLKENIADAEDASSLVDAIKVRQFDWKADGSHQRYGMVAQELLEVAPEAVSQPEDPDDMMGVDYSKLVPMLVKEIQSLRARMAQLEGA